MNLLNQGQVPVLACDQPLYAIAKKIQWNFLTVYGEKKLVVMFGGFHTELAALKALRSWVEDSGWTSVLLQAGVTTPGTADSFLKASHVSRTHHAHQVTAAALYFIMDKAYKKYREGVNEGEEPKSFSDWRKQAELEVHNFITGRLRFTSNSIIALDGIKTRNVKNNQRFRVVPGIGQEYSETRRARRFTPSRANERSSKHFPKSSERSL